MPDTRDTLRRQFEIAWALTSYHLNGLTTEECLWRPAPVGLHVHRNADGSWRADWPDREGYDIGPASIGWTTWHINFWWSMTLNHCFGDRTLQQADVAWPGSADGVQNRLAVLRQEWTSALDTLSDADLQSSDRSRWPLTDRPFGDIVAWLNVELMKNAAEIGYVRFLYAVT